MTDLWIIGIIALVYGFIAFRSSIYGLTVLVGVLPVYGLRFAVGPFPSTALEVLIAILVIAWFVRRRSLRNIYVPWRWLLLLFMLTATVAVLSSPDIRSALGLYRAYFLEPLLVFIVAVNTITSRAQMRTVLWGLGLGVLWIGLVALWQSLGILPSPEPWVSETPARVTSVFAYPNAVGLFVAPVVMLFVGLLLTNWGERRSWHRALFPVGVIIFGLIATGLSVTRGAFLGMIMSSVLVAWFSKKRFVLSMVLLAFLLLVVVLPGTRAQLLSVVKGTDVSADVRSAVWVGSARLLEDNLITGAGLAGFPILYEQYKLAKHTELLLYPHTLVFNFWTELGLAGVFVIVLILIRFFRTTAAGLQSRETRPFSVGLVAAMVTLLGHGLVDVPYFKNDLAVLFWVLCAFAIVQRRLLSETGRDR